MEYINFIVPFYLSTGHEIALERECWIPFGIKSHTMGPEGGDILLDTECDEDL